MAKYFDLRAFAAPQNQWVDITVSIACHRIVVENRDLTTSCFIRIVEGGPEKEIPPGQELDIDCAGEAFRPNDVIGAAKSAAATGANVLVSYTM